MVKPNKKQQLNWLEQFRNSESSASVLFGAIVVIVVGLLLFNFYKSGKTPLTGSGEQTTSENQGNKIGLPTKHTVVKGEHLWKIAEHYYGDGYKWVVIARENKLKNPSSINAGQELQIPALEEETKIAESTTSIQGSTYVTQKGDSLWKIAVAAYGDGYKWTTIWKANKQLIPQANRLFVGITLSLPR